VNQKFRDVIEGLEPGKQQFEPIEVVWKDGSHAGDYYWFFPLLSVSE
jgi:hypothetical protein